MWPETVYMDGQTKKVVFPGDRQASLIGCPKSWETMFKKMRREGKHPYMYHKLVVLKDMTPVGMAYRNYMEYIYDVVRFDRFKEDGTDQ